jgi:AraC-like DNA-binding protein
MSHLLLLQPDPRAGAALSAALDEEYGLRRVETWEELLREMGRSLPLGCVVDLCPRAFPSPETQLRMLRRTYPGVTIIVQSEFAGRELDLYRLGRLDVDGVIRMDGSMSPLRVRRVVASALAARLGKMVVESSATNLPPLARGCIRWAVEHAGSAPQVSDLAAAMALSPRALLRELKAMDLPTPRKLLLWCRLIHAAHLLERPGMTVECAAFRLGYSTGGALRKALKRHMGSSPTSLRNRGGLAWALEVFRRRALRRSEDRRDRWA